MGTSRTLAIPVLLLAWALLSGCASLPADVQRHPSEALTDVTSTRLGRIAAAATPDDKRHLSGFRLLPTGDYAFNARIALARRAEKTLDVQYYLIHNDDVGLQFLRELRDAAVRGVRVRVLVDDLYTAGEDELFAGLAAHPNVEVRLFNPLPARTDTLGSRVLFSLHEFGRVNHRMHNKLFIADNSFSVSGGRNIANEYFMRSESANFIDLDVISTGPIVRELSDVFDRYWNSEHAYPVHSLVPAAAQGVPARQRFDLLVRDVAPSIVPEPFDWLGRTSVDAQLDSGRLDQHFAAAHVFADSPAKVAGMDSQRADATAVASARNVMRSARSEVLIVSPYFIPGERGLAAMQEATDNQVSIFVLTNSLGATDEPLVHRAYARYRRAMLKLGVTLHELSPTLSRQSGRLGEFRSSMGRLHAKIAVIDRRWLLVGSMNMDGRSALANTEAGLLIDSTELAGEMLSLRERGRSSSTHRLRLGADGENIEWVAMDARGGEIVSTAEPDTSWLLQLRLWLLSPFVAEELL